MKEPRLTAHIRQVSAHRSPLQEFLLFLNTVKTLMVTGQDTGDFAFALSHVIFCMRASLSDNMGDHRCDSDSFLTAIDNCASRCITNDPADFVDGTVVPVSVSVRGIGGFVKATCKGTVRWVLEDDQGRKHAFKITDVHLNTSSPHWLMSPQHWAQVRKDNYPAKQGTHCATFQDATELHWGQRKCQRTIPLNPSSNVALVEMAPDARCLLACAASIAHTKSEPMSLNCWPWRI